MTPDKKVKTNRDKHYLAWLRRQPCCSCGRYPIPGITQIVPTHHGGGMGLKGDDSKALPLCVSEHGLEHLGFKTFWALVEYKTEKTREQHVKEHRRKYELTQRGASDPD